MNQKYIKSLTNHMYGVLCAIPKIWDRSFICDFQIEKSVSIVLLKLDLNKEKEYPEGYKFAIQLSTLLMWSLRFIRFADEYDNVDGFILSALDLMTNGLAGDDDLDEFCEAQSSFALFVATEVFALSNATFLSRNFELIASTL